MGDGCSPFLSEDCTGGPAFTMRMRLGLIMLLMKMNRAILLTSPLPHRRDMWCLTRHPRCLSSQIGERRLSTDLSALGDVCVPTPRRPVKLDEVSPRVDHAKELGQLSGPLTTETVMFTDAFCQCVLSRCCSCEY